MIFIMKRLSHVLATLMVLGTLLMPAVSSASSYYYPTTYSYTSSQATAARIQALMDELARLQAELARIQNFQVNTYTTACTYTTYGGYACPQYGNSYSYSGDTRSVSSITASFTGGAASVVVRYTRGSQDSFLFDARTQEEVIRYTAEQTGISAAAIRSLITFSNDRSYDNWYDHSSYNTHYSNSRDVDSIRITISDYNNNSSARVRFNDGTTRTYSYSTDVRSSIVSRLANDLDLSTSAVDNLANFSYDTSNSNSNSGLGNIDRIRVDITNSTASVRVTYSNGRTSNYTYNTSSHSTILDRLASDLGVNRSSLSDFITWD